MHTLLESPISKKTTSNHYCKVDAYAILHALRTLFSIDLDSFAEETASVGQSGLKK
jgi:hypothetical protein